MHPVLHEDAGAIESGTQTPAIVSAQIDLRRSLRSGASRGCRTGIPDWHSASGSPDVAGYPVVVLIVEGFGVRSVKAQFTGERGRLASMNSPMKPGHHDIRRETCQIEYLLGHRLGDQSGLEVTQNGELTSARRASSFALNVRGRFGPSCGQVKITGIVPRCRCTRRASHMFTLGINLSSARTLAPLVPGLPLV